MGGLADNRIRGQLKSAAGRSVGQINGDDHGHT
jgi:hypothetical protein